MLPTFQITVIFILLLYVANAQHFETGAFMVDVVLTTKVLKITKQNAEEKNKMLLQTNDNVDLVRIGYGRVRNNSIDGGNLHYLPEIQKNSDGSMQLLSAKKNDHGVSITGKTLDPENSEWVFFELRLFSINSNRLDFALKVINSTWKQIDERRHWLALVYNCPREEELYGLGEQFTFWNVKGKALNIITSEQGIGRGLQPITGILNSVLPGTGGSPTTTYTPLPSFLSHLGRAFLYNNTNLAFFDFTPPDYAVNLFWGATVVSGAIFEGDNPLELIESVTTVTGRMKMLPDWVLTGAIVGLEGGQENVSKIVDKLHISGMPIAGVWMQDWVGIRGGVARSERLIWNWQLNLDWYPLWQEMVSNWSAIGIKPLTYINPYLTNVSGSYHRHNYFDEAITAGYFVKNRAGDAYLLSSGTIHFGMIDFTNPDARDWYQNMLVQNVIGEAKSFGWMADFGEYLPLDSVLFDGSDPISYHNQYPSKWAELNQRAIESVEHTEDLVYFMRSGDQFSPARTRLYWMGDQLHTFDEHDGLQSALIAMLNAGLSGWTLAHSDIGGYTTVDYPEARYARTPELLKRWSEMSAFSDAVFRTHPGSSPLKIAQIYDDPESIAHFTKFAYIHANLSNYKKNLMVEASTKGRPMVRSLMLHYPSDPRSRSENSEFLLGEHILVAPIFKKSTTSRSVYFPQGNWIHVWSMTNYSADASGTVATIKAPIGEPAVFVMQANTYDWKALIQLIGGNYFDFLK